MATLAAETGDVLAMEGLRQLRVHPDGQRIVFDAGHVQHEVWVPEDFLPELKPAE